MENPEHPNDVVIENNIWKIIYRFFAISVILAITAFFTPGFTSENVVGLIIAIFVLIAVDYFINKFTRIHTNSFGQGFIGFILAIITLYVTQFFLTGYSLSCFSAIIGALIYAIIDYLAPI